MTATLYTRAQQAPVLLRPLYKASKALFGNASAFTSYRDPSWIVAVGVWTEDRSAVMVCRAGQGLTLKAAHQSCEAHVRSSLRNALPSLQHVEHDGQVKFAAGMLFSLRNFVFTLRPSLQVVREGEAPTPQYECCVGAKGETDQVQKIVWRGAGATQEQALTAVGRGMLQSVTAALRALGEG